MCVQKYNQTHTFAHTVNKNLFANIFVQVCMCELSYIFVHVYACVCLLIFFSCVFMCVFAYIFVKVCACVCLLIFLFKCVHVFVCFYFL